VADDPRPPVAIRVTRPYANEDEFLQKELETVTKTSIVLLGAQSRPQGVVLRFELALTSGAALVRGEGRVVSFRERALGDLPGLTLRFTRLDSRSKALVDRAATMREARARISSLPPAPPAPPEPPPSPPRQAPPAVRTEPAPKAPANEPRKRSKRPTPQDEARGGDRGRVTAPLNLTSPVPANRDELLGRLRERARSLDAVTVAQILAKPQ
jgi:hypothetical protein